MLHALEAARDQYVKEFIKCLNPPDEAWIWETAYKGLNEELEALENKYINHESRKIPGKNEGGQGVAS